MPNCLSIGYLLNNQKTRLVIYEITWNNQNRKQPKWTITYLFKIQEMCKNGYLLNVVE